MIRLLNGRSLASRFSDRLRGAPPTALVILPIFSVQLGAALAKSLFDYLGPGGMDFGPVGVAFALLAGCLWACYILLSVRTGSAFPGGTGLVIALCMRRSDLSLPVVRSHPSGAWKP